MVKIEWQDDLAVGTVSIDTEHRGLVDLLARAQAAYSAGNVRSAVRLLRQFLTDFSRHFDGEQRLLSRVGCPAVTGRGSEYRTSHAIFSVHPLEADDVEVIGQMIEYANAWLIDHIIRQDLPLKSWFTGLTGAGSGLGFHIKLRWRIGLMALVPLLALGALVAASVWELDRTEDSMRLMARMNHLNGQIGDVIHELQHERGLATLFLNDRRPGRGRLMQQMARTDQATARLREAALQIQGDLPDGPARDRLSNALISIDLIREIRDDLSASSYDAVETMDFYTTAIEDLAVVVPDVIRTVLPSDFAKLTFAQVFLQHAKERAGRERAAGIAALSAATPELSRQSVRDLASEQRALGAGFVALAPADLAAAYHAADRLAESPLTWMRQAVESGEIDQLSVQEWFDITTRRIDALRAVETEVSARLGAEAAALERGTRERLLLLGSGMAVLALLSLAMMAGLGWSILPPLVRLADSVRRLAGGDRLVSIPGLAARDELGAFARVVQNLKERLVHGDLLEARRLTANAERLRVVADNTPGVVFRVHQPESGPPVVVCASRKLREVVGLSPLDMVDKPLWKVIRELCRPSDWTGLLRALQLAGHRPMNFEFQLRDGPLGSGRWLRVAASPSPTDGGWVWDGVALDVTVLRAAEEERGRITAELARIRGSQTAASLSDGIGQEVSAALTPLVSHVERAAHQVPEGSPGHDDIGAALSDARLLAQLVDRLLQASPPGEAARPGEPHPTDNVIPFKGTR